MFGKKENDELARLPHRERTRILFWSCARHHRRHCIDANDTHRKTDFGFDVLGWCHRDCDFVHCDSILELCAFDRRDRIMGGVKVCPQMATEGSLCHDRSLGYRRRLRGFISRYTDIKPNVISLYHCHW